MSLPLPIIAFFLGHWWISVFFQTFFLHRYGAHRMFTMSPRWERFFYVCTYLAQGSSFLNPRAYAILHRMHHAYSDTPKDPHSPVQIPNPVRMMNRTRDIYRDIQSGRFPVEERFLGGYPEWKAVDRIGGSWVSSLTWGGLYTLVYLYFATEWWHLLFAPVSWFMGPIHGAIVNWFGHWAGYRNFETKDGSRNTLPFDFVTLGELFQNNHHQHGSRPNFAARRWELDPTWPVVWVLDRVGVIRLSDKRATAKTVESQATAPAVSARV